MAAMLSVGLGASVIEKHFTSDKTLIGPDHRASSTPTEFKALVSDIRRAHLQLGSAGKVLQKEEYGMHRNSRKSLVYTREIKKGELFQLSDFTMKRPGTGLPWDQVKYFLGNKARHDCQHNQICFFTDIE